MLNSKAWSNKPNKIPGWLLATFLVLAFVGFTDASYLTIKHFKGEAPNCSVLAGCDIVTGSQYSTIAGVPVALLGALYYLTLLILAVIYFDTKKTKWFYLAAKLTPIGLVASAYFVYLQLFVIKSICLYCMVSATSSTLLFFCAMMALKSKKSNAEDKHEPS